MSIDVATSRTELLDQVRAAHDAGYIWARNPNPLDAVDLMTQVADEARRW